MVTLRLFHVADPFRPIETRTLGEAEIHIGRDPAADWAIDDSACELSRRHCIVKLAPDGVRVRDVSANGVFMGRERRRLQRNVETLVQGDDVIHLGQFMIAVESALTPANDSAPPDADEGQPLDAPFHSPMLQEPALSAEAFAVRRAWEHEEPTVRPPNAAPDATLLEAFCEGAGLEPSLFAGERPADVLRRVGAVYQQTVLGISDLMSERTSLKTEYRLSRTTVGAANNNPFKWSDPHHVAIDLLRADKGPFLDGACAVNESFQDIKKHILCVMAGSRAALSAALEELQPEKTEEAVGANRIFASKSAFWREFRRRHARLAHDARENVESLLNRAFKSGYERQVRKLDGLGTLS
jgi:predicted component of type VI protein secretion system